MTARAPPALVVKPNVTGTPALFTTLSLPAIPKETAVTAPTMYPDDVLWDDNGSRLVVTMTGPPAVGVDPMDRPMSVTLTVEYATKVPETIAIQIWESLVCPEFADDLPFRITSVGVTPDAKNPEGYTKVMVSVDDRVPAALGTKLNVTDTPAFIMIRSLFEISNETAVTAPPIYPD